MTHVEKPEQASQRPQQEAGQEARYRDLVENASDIVYTHDLTGWLTSWNRAGEEILGFSDREIRSMNIAQTVTHEHLERARRMIARKVAEGGQTIYELEVRAKDVRT